MSRPSRSADVCQIIRRALGPVPFTAAQLATLGISRGTVRHMLAEGVLVRLRPGVYVLADASDEGSRSTALRGALLAVRGSYAVYDSAAHVHRLPLPVPSLRRVHIARKGATFRAISGTTVHHPPLVPHHVTVIDGVPTTTLARTAVDIARRYRLPRALIVVDAALRRIVEAESGVDQQHIREAVLDVEHRDRAMHVLAAAAKDLSGWPGIVRAREAIRLGDPASESPLESYSQGSWPDHGIPMPRCGVPVVGADGRTYWADKLWEEYGVIGECDGLLKYDDPDALRKEKLRQEALEQAGWIVVRWTWEEIIQRPHVVALRIRDAFARARRLRTA